MSSESLIFQTSPRVILATNTFINVPVILQYEEEKLIEIVKDVELGFTTQIPIYHPDGTYLAKVNGTRMYRTEAGEKAGLVMDKHPSMVACKLGNQTLFEIHNQPGDSFKIAAELHTPDGYFVKCMNETLPQLLDINGSALQIGGMIMTRGTFVGSRIGILIQKNSISFGVN